MQIECFKLHFILKYYHQLFLYKYFKLICDVEKSSNEFVPKVYLSLIYDLVVDDLVISIN